MRFCICVMICAFFSACADNGVINLGSLKIYKPSQNLQTKKPKKEIAKLCHSGFNDTKSFRILTIENLLNHARELTGKSEFSNVGIWQKEIDLYFWHKKCLILGE